MYVGICMCVCMCLSVRVCAVCCKNIQFTFTFKLSNSMFQLSRMARCMCEKAAQLSRTVQSCGVVAVS